MRAASRVKYFANCVWFMPPDPYDVSPGLHAASAVDFLLTVDKKFHSVLRVIRPDGMIELFACNAKDRKSARDMYKKTLPLVTGNSIDSNYFTGYRYLFGKLGE